MRVRVRVCLCVSRCANYRSDIQHRYLQICLYISDIPPYISNIHPYTVLYTADMHQTESVEDDGSADEYFDTIVFRGTIQHVDTPFL